jgi:hypothetical protein
MEQEAQMLEEEEAMGMPENTQSPDMMEQSLFGDGGMQ